MKRAIWLALNSPNTITGMMICFVCCQNALKEFTCSVVSYIDGNQPSQTEKIKISSGPVKNVGTANPTIVTNVPTWSNAEY